MSAWAVLAIIASVLVLVYLSVAVVVGRFLVYSSLPFMRRHCPDGTVELQGYNYSDIQFQTADHLTLRGWFVRSSNNPTNRTLFVIPGWMRTRTRYLAQIKSFVDSGFHVFTYDQRSHGASDTGVTTYGPKEGKDLLTAVEYSRGLGDVNQDKLAVVGFSYGSTAAIYAATSQIFKAVVLEGVFASSYDMGESFLLRSVGRRLTRLFGYLFFWVGAMIWTLGKFKHSYPADVIGDVSPTPVMLIRGEEDATVPSESAQKVLDAAKEPKEIWVHPSGHTWAFDSFPEEYEKRVLGFLDSYL
jgi:dipeptidyl aminopeptidase/acylaminoacyl peptidase